MTSCRTLRSLFAVATCVVATATWPQQPFDLDPAFRTTIPSVYVSSILPRTDGKVLISGRIQSSPGTLIGGMLLNHDGSRDMNYPEAVHMGGKLTAWNDRIYAQSGIGVRRLLQDGSLDPDFSMGMDEYVSPLQGGDYHVYPDGRLLASGVYILHDTLHGFLGAYCLVWFTNTGELDTTAHHRTCAGSLDFFTELPNGQFIGSGSTSIWDGQAASNIVRFNADGSLDPGFQAHVWWGQAYCFLPMADGRVYAGGNFRVNGLPDTLTIVRFMPDGSLDPTFYNTAQYKAHTMSNGWFGGLIRKILPLPDGRIIVTGQFDHIDGQPRGCIALLDSSGTLLDDYFTGAGAGNYTYQGTTTSSLGITSASDGNYYIWGGYHGYDDGTTNDPTQRFVSRLYGLNVGIAEHGAGQPQQLHMAPNPSSGPTTFTTTAPLQKGMLQVHDTSGRLVLDRAWPAGNSSYTLESGALAPGAYVVRVAAGSAARDLAGGYVYAGRLVVLP